ncbi:hypothetical protein DCO45_09730 [Comamonas sp. JNW]|nr:hypothetical protein DCO45_09730 [Comamonas sp. JNW]
MRVIPSSAKQIEVNDGRFFIQISVIYDQLKSHFFISDDAATSIAQGADPLHATITRRAQEAASSAALDDEPSHG